MTALNPPTFHPTDLNDFQSFKQKFFTGEREIDALNSMPASVYKRPEGSLYYSRFEVMWAQSTIPFRKCYSIFLRATSTLLNCAPFKKTARRISLKAQSSDWYIQSIRNQRILRGKIVVPSCNNYAPEARYLTQFESIPRENLKDPFLRKHLPKFRDRVTFNNEEGLCGGSVEWLNYLFLLGLHKKIPLAVDRGSYREYMTAISQLFKNGQPIQSALLQSIRPITNPILGVKETTFGISEHATKSKGALVKSLNILPNGLYLIATAGHGMSLMKSQNELLLHDSNVGLLNLKRTDELAAWLELYMEGSEGRTISCMYHTLGRPGIRIRIASWISIMRFIWSHIVAKLRRRFT